MCWRISPWGRVSVSPRRRMWWVSWNSWHKHGTNRLHCCPNGLRCCHCRSERIIWIVTRSGRCWVLTWMRTWWAGTGRRDSTSGVAGCRGHSWVSGPRRRGISWVGHPWVAGTGRVGWYTWIWLIVLMARIMALVWRDHTWIGSHGRGLIKDVSDTITVPAEVKHGIKCSDIPVGDVSHDNL